MIKSSLFIALLSCIIQVNAQVINTIAGNGSLNYTGDGGPATSATFRFPWGVTCDVNNNLYIVDNENMVVRTVNPSGVINTVVGDGVLLGGYSGDGGPAMSAELSYPADVIFDQAGNMYISDLGNHVIRKVNTSGIITTFAGNGFGAGSANGGFSGDGGPATSARLNQPDGMVFDAAGNLIFVDSKNYRVRKISTSGIITTIAGNGVQAYGGDGGPATAASFYAIGEIAIDVHGNIYISESGSVGRIRMIDYTTGIITTVAGGVNSALGDGGPAISAAINQPVGMVFDKNGNLYFADISANRIRKINTSGIIFTVAGTGVAGFSGDGGPAISATINQPSIVALDTAGNLIFSDWTNNRVRKFLPSSQNGVITQPVSNTICETTNTTFSIMVCSATSVQWQEDNGSGFTNLTNGGVYSGVNTSVLSLQSVPYSMNGNRYRCIVYNTVNDTSISVTLQVKANHTIITASSPAFCTSSSIDTLTVSGASSYSWSDGSTGNTVVVPTPTATNSVTYSVTGTSNGCSTSASITIHKFYPTVGVVLSNQYYSNMYQPASVCKDLWVKVTGSGLINYKWLPGNDTTPAIIRYPSSNITYTLQGYDANGCFETATATFNVDTSSLYITALDTPACMGSNIGLWETNTGGGNWYINWYQNGTMIGTYANIGPIITTPVTTFSLTGYNSNGCRDTVMLKVNAINGCIWPGDTDEDLQATNLDLLPIGLKFGATGPPRSAAQQDYHWYGYKCGNWSDTLSNGKNIKYADCNGDGIINLTDTLSVYLNYGSSHLAKNTTPYFPQFSNRDVYVQYNKSQYYPGDTVLANVYIGSFSNPQNNFYGAAFTLNFDHTKLDTNSLKFNFNDSWVGKINQQKIKLSKIRGGADRADISLVRITHTDTGGFGKIGTLQFILKNNINTYGLLLTVTNGIKTNSNGVTAPLVTGLDSVFVSPNCIPTITGNTITCSGQSLSLHATGATSFNWMPGNLNGGVQTVTPATSTIYTITGSNAYGCQRATSFSVQINPSPNVSFSIGFPNPLCVNAGSQTLSGGSPAGGNYNGAGISGSLFFPNNTGVGAFELQYYYTNNYNCSGMASDTVFVVLCNGVKEFQKQNLVVYPNPVSNIFTIRFEEALGTITIYNSLGEIVLQTESKNKEEQIDVSRFSSGVYTVLVQGKYQKLIKE